MFPGVWIPLTPTVIAEPLALRSSWGALGATATLAV